MLPAVSASETGNAIILPSTTRSKIASQWKEKARSLENHARQASLANGNPSPDGSWPVAMPACCFASHWASAWLVIGLVAWRVTWCLAGHIAL